MNQYLGSIGYHGLLLVGVFFFGSSLCVGDEVEQKEKPKEKTKYDLQIDRSLERYKVFVGDEKKPTEPLHVLTWNNPIAGGSGRFRTMVFVREGQAKAICCIWGGIDRMYHEFGSLSRDLIRGELDGKRAWDFDAGAVEFAEIPDAKPPAEDRKRRLLQMKQLVRRFKAIETRSRQGLPARIELRLLARPLYRYEKSSERIEDGAVFCFAHTTDPEAVLVIEAVQSDKKLRWEYAFVRRSTLPVVAELDGEEVWSTTEAGYDAFNQRRYVR